MLMTRILFLFLFYGLSLSHAQEPQRPYPLAQKIIQSLKRHGLNCLRQDMKSCSYFECRGFLTGYPQPVLITLPQEIRSLRIHFHGHILGLTESKQYEKDPSSMIAALGLNKNLCQTNEISVFPWSLGKNKTYQEYFTHPQAYFKFLRSLEKQTEFNFSHLPLHFSGHSGGGKFVAQALNIGLNVAWASIYDGIYQHKSKVLIKNWFLLGNKKLLLATVKGMTPDHMASELIHEISPHVHSSQQLISGTLYDIHQIDQFIHLSRSKDQLGPIKAHYEVLKQIWPLENLLSLR